MKIKRIHRLGRMYSKIRDEWDVRPLCKVDNKTYRYNKTTNWKEVTCLKCLNYITTYQGAK